MGKWLMAAALGALLAVAVWVFYRNWILVDVDLPPWGWISLVAGVVATLAVGVGLMALIFYSSRMGYDEPPQSSDPHDDAR